MNYPFNILLYIFRNWQIFVLENRMKIHQIKKKIAVFMCAFKKKNIVNIINIMMFYSTISDAAITQESLYLNNMLFTLFSSEALDFLPLCFPLRAVCCPRAIWPVSVSPQCNIGHNWPWVGETHAGRWVTLSRDLSAPKARGFLHHTRLLHAQRELWNM